MAATNEKNELPPYSAVALPAPTTYTYRPHWPRLLRRSSVKKLGLYAVLTIVFTYVALRAIPKAPQARLSQEKLSADLETCKALHAKPQDAIGLGRDKNARYVDGHKPTLIKNATIWVGEPAEGTSDEDARAGRGWSWVSGDVFLEHGLIKTVNASIPTESLPDDTVVYLAEGRPLTAGVIDMHSHAGVDPLPALNGYTDYGEWGDNISPWARIIDAIYPFDHQIQVIKSGGVTTSLILPGSANNIGGEAFVIKHAVGKPDGRQKISVRDLLADPQGQWRYMKMACGENPKMAHGGVDKVPVSRMGESYAFRQAFTHARELVQRQDDWCSHAEAVGVDGVSDYLPRDLAWEALAAVLRGQVHVNIHCYTVPDLESMVEHSNTFEFPIRAFHHAHQTHLIPETLKRAWGGRPPALAIFADNMYYKTEAYIGSEFAGKILYDNNLTAVYVSDNPVLNAQHVLFEAAKGAHYGLPYHAALAAVTSAPAELLGLGQRLGKIKPGFDADVVVWDSYPLSVGATPRQVWIDGTAQFEGPIELNKQNPHQEMQKPGDSPPGFVEEATEKQDALFTGIRKVLLTNDEEFDSSEDGLNVVVTGGQITCIGLCLQQFQASVDAGVKPVSLSNGYLVNAFVGVGGTLGLNAIDLEASTDNGANPIAFTRALDGLMLDSKKLRVADRYGVTRAISAPKFTGQATHHGTSAGFLTGAKTSLEEGAVFADDLAVHYTLDQNVRSVNSYSAAFGALRAKLLAAAGSPEPVLGRFSEEAHLKRVVHGEAVLALSINSADGIATALRIKTEIEDVILAASDDENNEIRMAIIGGAESHLLAKELAAANVGVILAPLQSTGEAYDARRVLTGAPLTNGTTIDALLDAGVLTGIGLHEDWQVRDLGFAAGTALANGGGRLTEKSALDLISVNVFKILGAGWNQAEKSGHFIVSEGSPLKTGSRIKTVGSGRGKVAIYV